MADENKPKVPGKGAENTLGLIGTIAGLVGNLAFGPDSLGMDFGAPFKLAAQAARDKREQKGLMDLLGSHPETANLLEHGDALINAGGIANNMDILDHPDLQGLGGGGEDSDIPAGASPPIQPTQSSLLSTLQPQAPVDYSSPEFIQKAAIYRPDIAEKLLLASGKSNSELDDLKAILLGQQIQNYETPEQKRQARQEERQANMEFMDKLISGRQTQQKENSVRLEKSKITSKESEHLQNLDALKNLYQQIRINLEEGAEPSYFKSLVGSTETGDKILQTTSPKFSEFKKNIDQMVALYQKSISGVAISEPEARRLRVTQPSAGDDKDFLVKFVENTEKKQNELQFIYWSNIAKRGGDVSGYVDAETLRKYNLLREAMNTDLAGALKSPKVQALRNQLGIDYSIEVKSPKKGKK